MEGFNDYLELAENGDIDAGLVLAKYYLFESEDDIEEDTLERIKGYVSRAVDDNRLEAIRMVADMYFDGRGVEQDRDKASFWYMKAAEMGDASSLEQYKECRKDDVDHERDFKAYALAASKGDPLGYFRIGDMYTEGLFVEKDLNEAFNSYILAYDLACKDKESEIYPDICMKIAECFMEGRGVESNILTAKNLYEEANFRLRVLVNKGNDDKLEEYRFSEKCLNDIEEKIKTPCFNTL